jgi:dCTP deaminase
MPFWSGQTLRSRLADVIDNPDLESIDCAAYTLKVGPEYYVTPNDQCSNPGSITLQSLAAREAFAVPAGQFGYVLTEEAVSVPTSTIAFISIRARIKWKGLINVSGFHVDPGFSGRLLFAVYNAGPGSIHLRRGDPTFLIWFADLDQDSPTDSKKGMKPVTQIDTGAINQVTGVIYSVQGLADKIRTTEKELAKRITSLERENGIVKVLAGAILAIMITLAGQWVVRQFANTEASPRNEAPPPQPAPTQPPQQN